ncbi:MAG: ATP-binding protein [Planctomycetota bacterium]
MDPGQPRTNREHSQRRAEIDRFLRSLSLCATYDAVLDCVRGGLPRLFDGVAGALLFPVVPEGHWSIAAPSELEGLIFGAGELGSDLRVPIEGSEPGLAFEEGSTVGARSDLEQESLLHSRFPSRLSVPLLDGTQSIGVLLLASQKADAFCSQVEEEALEIAAVMAVQCVLHRRLEEAKRAAEREAETARIVSLLQRLQLKLAHIPDEEGVCKTTAHYLKRIFRSDEASFALLDEERENVTLRALSGRQGIGQEVRAIPLAGSVYESSIQQKRARIWRKEAQGLEAAPEMLSGITAPLASGSDVIGTLNLASQRSLAFGAGQLAYMTELGRILGTALASLRAHSALRLAQEEAEAASAAKGAFLANVSHELRTPLNGVLGMAKLLEGTTLDAEQAELLGTIKSSGQLLMRVISDVLEVSKIESGSAVLEALIFDPRKTIEKACSMVMPAAMEKGLALEVECLGDVPEAAIGDPTRLQQIVVNLLSNAVKFTAKGGVYVTLTLLKSTETDHRVRVDVRDTGKGIAQDAIERIFVPFQQEEASTTRRFGGTGLGLSICRQFAELMGGGISATSEVGSGSCFSVEVVFGRAEEAPLATDEKGVGHESGEVDDELRADFADRHPLRLLVVDDNPVNRRVAQRLLQRLGYKPELAPGGGEAIEETAKNSYDLVFMDLSMPEVDGFEASEAILGRASSGHVPVVVALTADVQETTRQRCLEEGLAGLLAKPFSVGALKVQLRRVHAELVKQQAA